MAKLNCIHERVFLYSFKNGKIKLFEGSIFPYFYRENKGVFRSKDKRFLCSREPKVMHNSNVWLLEQDDELVREIFIEGYKQKVEALEKEIEKMTNKTIKLLRGEV